MPKSAPPPVSCRFCTALATGTGKGTGGAAPATGPIPHCDKHWDETWEIIRNHPDRCWAILEQPQGLF